jgi:hypothetical protein
MTGSIVNRKNAIQAQSKCNGSAKEESAKDLTAGGEALHYVRCTSQRSDFAARPGSLAQEGSLGIAGAEGPCPALRCDSWISLARPKQPELPRRISPWQLERMAEGGGLWVLGVIAPAVKCAPLRGLVRDQQMGEGI